MPKTKKLSNESYPLYSPVAMSQVMAVQFHQSEDPGSWPDCVVSTEIKDIVSGEVTSTYYTVENANGEAIDINDGDYIVITQDPSVGNLVMSEKLFLENFKPIETSPEAGNPATE